MRMDHAGDAAAPLLEVEGLAKHYPVRQGLLPSLLGRAPPMVRAVDGVSFRIAPGRGAGAGGQIRLRQVHHGHGGAGSRLPDRGADPRRGPRRHGAARPRGQARLPARRADRLPESLRGAEPALHRAGERARADRRALPRVARRAGGARPAGAGTRRPRRRPRSMRGAIRTSSRAGSCSAWRSRGPSAWSRACWWRTSRSRCSMSRSAPASSACFAASRARWRWRSSTSRTTSRRCATSARTSR